ncbi:ABC transporter permease, partial [Patescibacteria group bacterium]|nr:ABC transporter permease [Patescibacteria group bacterium]
MVIFEFKIAFKNLKKHLLRTILSISGITIGITTIIIILSIGGAIEGLVLGQLDNLGSDNLFVEVKVPTGKNETKNAMAIAQGVTITTLKSEDTDEVETLPNVDFAYSATTGQGVLTYRSEEKKVMYWASTPEIPAINGFKIENGRFFTDEEDKGIARVVVLGYNAAEELFGREDPIGKSVKLDKLSFKVIGVAEERGIEMFTNVDDNIHIPLKTAQKLLLGTDHILFMGIRMKDEKLLNETVANIQSVIRKRHQINDPDKDDFAVRTLEESAEILGTVTFGIQALLLVIGAISLIV